MTDPRDPSGAEPRSGASAAPGGDRGPPDPASSIPRRGIRSAVGRPFGLLARIPHPPLRSRRGWFIIVVLIAGLASALTIAGAAAVSWTETADFCGRCHTMDPELKAYAQSPHRDVPCAECHVEPGIGGWIKSKVNGTRQILLLLAGAYPTPIPAPDHADLPPTNKTCLRCHDVKALTENGGPVRLVIQERYKSDEANSKDSIALVLRPSGFGSANPTRGVHWHIVQDVEYLTPDLRARTIDYVAMDAPGGPKEYIASSQITDPSDVQPDIDRLKAEQRQRRMDCIDCHNRVGHGVLSPEAAIDDALAAGQIDPELPYVKREASVRLSADHASLDEADRTIEGLRTFYRSRYPLVANTKARQINATIDSLKGIYRLVATPEMRVTGTTYPSNLGHQASPGCFRCHDGAHYRVRDGAKTAETIPSACATCHTFPQIGSSTSGVLIGGRPTTHDNRLWVFDHKLTAGSLDPSGTSCGSCHTRPYCENCHNTEAVHVPHDDMVYNHGAVLRNVGAQACAYCHQQPYCAQCHANPVLPDPFAPSGAPASSPDETSGPTSSPGPGP
ncbi:MAG TPA: NapC/NirT family cytochrome c [Candidatus Limnocylindrales bacterium]|nr:NapC/NirT family cytochrome c [Candidatus Limnocylindrales bacterium]